MSSGGANSTTITPGYGYQLNNIRDSSDWISLKKQVRVRNDSKLAVAKDPWFVRGNDVRLTYQQGSFKRGAFPGCTPCPAAAFSGNGAF
jgi:hypothetical protein